MWPGFDSRSRRHMWVEFVVGSRPCSERFFSGYPSFPPSTKTNISKFQFDLETVERRATPWIPLKFPSKACEQAPKWGIGRRQKSSSIPHLGACSQATVRKPDGEKKQPGGGVTQDVLCGEAPPGGPNPYPFTQEK